MEWRKLSPISKYGTRHSEAVTNNYFYLERFIQEVDAAEVYVNASPLALNLASVRNRMAPDSMQRIMA